MFLKASVILLTGGSTWHPQDQVHPPGPGTSPWDQVHPSGPGTPPRTRYTPWDQVQPLGPGTPPSSWDQVPPRPGTLPDQVHPLGPGSPPGRGTFPWDQVHPLPLGPGTPPDQVPPRLGTPQTRYTPRYTPQGPGILPQCRACSEIRSMSGQ